jgi:hypothetical protein
MEQAAPKGISGSHAGGPSRRAAGGPRPAAAPSAAGRAGAPRRARRARGRRLRGGAARRGPDPIETGQVRPDTPRGSRDGRHGTGAGSRTGRGDMRGRGGGPGRGTFRAGTVAPRRPPVGSRQTLTMTVLSQPKYRQLARKVGQIRERCVTTQVPGIQCPPLARGGIGPPSTPCRRPGRARRRVPSRARDAPEGLPAKVRAVLPCRCTCTCKGGRHVLPGVGHVPAGRRHRPGRSGK